MKKNLETWGQKEEQEVVNSGTISSVLKVQKH